MAEALTALASALVFPYVLIRVWTFFRSLAGG